MNRIHNISCVVYKDNGWLPAASVQNGSQYALGELWFVTLNKTPESFDLIDGIKQPNNVVKGILEQLYKAAEEETRTTHALNKYNYQRLLAMIDSNQDGYYSEQEYLQAVHNVSYRDHLYRVIAKHASEWYYGKDDPLWKTYLDTLTTASCGVFGSFKATAWSYDTVFVLPKWNRNKT
ncbi:hypothetical protein [Trabulsiella odontotermitis]|uniref:hypothetical protein n=1 Tax=Trabulsiella odontotermitis TaxID=379893 RepID=UPI0006BA4453|nr:hypothetical protein [Trabulsiella odontotermitis]